MDKLLQHATQLASQPAQPLTSPIPGRIAYVVSHGQSYASNGYAIRTQGIAKALNEHGFDTLCFVRPGRPWELGIEKGSITPEMQVDGVRYIHSRWENDITPSSELAKFVAMVERFIHLFRIYRPQVVLAASNHEVGLPALAAAKALGLPFHYEVRGFWEISRASREPGWEKTQEYQRHYNRESWVCNNADHLYTLNSHMQKELIQRGAKAPIKLVPNSVSVLPANIPQTNASLRRQYNIPEQAFVVGYIGAITQYEGLEQLVEALVELKSNNVHALIVGGYSPVNKQAQPAKESIVDELKALANKLGVADCITFTGRVDHGRLPEYFSAIDATVIPRKPLPVCELVSAIKPLEYLSYGKPVIASNVAPQAELLQQGELGWLYQKGSTQDLVNTIKEVKQASTELLQAKALKGQETVKNNYLWNHSVSSMVKAMRNPNEVRKGPRVACIMDDFTYQSYSPEGNFQQLTPENWQQELQDFEPELLFIESAWRGKDELWGSKVGHKSREVQGIVQWCNEHKIPTIFWNKEDPVHFETFLNTAKLFDHVFTTDLDCIHRYKAALGHNRVYFLPFACQPRLTNPIETYQRKNAFCFAGAYYVRYPERTKDLETFVEEFPKFRPLEIYDRNYGKDDPNYQFPENYQPYIVGTLPFSEIDKAYKGYRYAINLNSIKQSQSMFARRVYELLGSNTFTVSNFSRGVRLLFGDLVFTSDSGAEIVNRLETLESSGADADKLRLAGLRKVLQEHTYQDRLNYILSKVTGKEYQHTMPCFTVVSLVNNEQELTNTLISLQRQNYSHTSLTLVIGESYSPSQAQKFAQDKLQGRNIKTVSLQSLEGCELNSLVAQQGNWLAAFSPQDYYGPNYLMDMALATRFTDAPIIGKAEYYQAQEGIISKVFTGQAYTAGAELPIRATVIAPAAQQGPALHWTNTISHGTYNTNKQQAIDPFNYASNGLEETEQTNEVARNLAETVNDKAFDTGLPLAKLIRIAETTEPKGATEDQIPSYNPTRLNEIFSNPGSATSKVKLTDEGLKVTSTLEDGKHEYIYVKAGNDLPIETLIKNQPDKTKLPLHLEMTPGLNLSLVVFILGEKGARLHHNIIQTNKNNVLDIPDGTRAIRLGFRVYQAGECTIKKLLLGKKDLSPETVLGRADVLLVTNHYPSYDDLYRNGFVHSRVKAYQERNVSVDIFRFRKDQAVSWHEFQDVDVITGSETALRRMLESGQYRHVLVHFLDEGMWEILGNFIDTIKVTVWVHGAEVQPWWRREYNYSSEAELEVAKVESAKRLGFWQQLLNPMPKNLKLIFVSQYFAEEVMEDIGFRLSDDKYEIIHNPVDTDLFSYQEKEAKQRKKILSIRPYASRKYANDLSVSAVLELAKEPFFNELEFRFIGDGKLFDEVLEPLKGFSNVTIERGFLAQPEIAKLHKEYGVFLCPTRMDAQGVSKDEAMSSGLVVVTNGVTAIPEFIDNNSGIVVDGEDFIGMAKAIKLIHQNINEFNKKSSEASKRARIQVNKNTITNKELLEFI